MEQVSCVINLPKEIVEEIVEKCGLSNISASYVGIYTTCVLGEAYQIHLLFTETIGLPRGGVMMSLVNKFRAVAAKSSGVHTDDSSIVFTSERQLEKTLEMFLRENAGKAQSSFPNHPA